MSRLTLVAAAVLLVVAPAVASAQAVNRAAAAKQIEDNERAINAAIQKGDVATFQKLIAPDAKGVDAMGIGPVSEFIKMMPQIKIASWTIEQAQVNWINDTTAVLSYRWTGSGTIGGQPFPSPVWASSVWVNRGGSWVAVFHQETNAAPAPPAKK